MLGIIDFLDNREKATVFWAAVVLVFAAIKSDGLGGSFLAVLRAFVAPKLLLIWGLAALYCAGIVFTADQVGLWQVTATKETIYWFFGTGAVLIGGAVTTPAFDGEFLKRLVRNALRLTIFVAFLLNLYVMPFAAEFVFVPVVGLLAFLQVVATDNPEMAAARKLIDGMLIVIGLALMLYVTVKAATDRSGLLTREYAERLLLPPALTLALVPLLYLVWRASRWDYDRTMRHWREGTDPPR